MNAAHFYGGLNSQKDSILTIGRKRHKCTFKLPLTCSEWCMLKHGRKEGRDRRRAAERPKSWKQSEKSYPTLAPASCQINLKVVQPKRLRDVARSRGPHPFGEVGKG